MLYFTKPTLLWSETFLKMHYTIQSSCTFCCKFVLPLIFYSHYQNKYRSFKQEVRSKSKLATKDVVNLRFALLYCFKTAVLLYSTKLTNEILPLQSKDHAPSWSCIKLDLWPTLLKCYLFASIFCHPPPQTQYIRLYIWSPKPIRSNNSYVTCLMTQVTRLGLKSTFCWSETPEPVRGALSHNIS